jgi:hypothetical protein
MDHFPGVVFFRFSPARKPPIFVDEVEQHVRFWIAISSA